MNIQSYEEALLSQENDEALRRIVSTRPKWTGIVTVRDVVKIDGRFLFHAGPEFVAFGSIPRPVLNSLVFGCIFEGWTKDWEEAEALLSSGEIEILPAQDHDFLVPLAGVISPSMKAIRISDTARQSEKFCVLNEGNEIASRLGRRDDRLVDHHKWLNGDFGDWLTGCLTDPIDLLPIWSESFTYGDDGHAQTAEGSRLISAALRRRAFDTPGKVGDFLNGSAAFALNIWMASAALLLQAAEGIQGSTLVTRAGGNGAQFGYSISGNPTKWWIAEGPTPKGTVEARFDGHQPVPAVGDSAVIDFLGLGGLNLAGAPKVVAGLGSHLPGDALSRGSKILCGKHPALGGRMVGCLAERALRYGHGPIVLIGMIDAEGEAGRIGGGVLDVSGALFRDAVGMVA